MILNRTGATFTYDGITYSIGDRVVATSESAYEGLFGTILEIRTGNDKSTDNDTPDFHCEFIPPALPAEAVALEARFSALYQQKKVLDEIALDEVIMAPEMIRVINPNGVHSITVYTVHEEWVLDGDYGENRYPALDPDHAKLRLTELIHNDRAEGCISKWREHGVIEEDVTGENYYECWVQDAYCENHYKVSIETQTIHISEDVFTEIGKAFVDRILRRDFAEQIEDWEEISGLSDAQIANMIAQPCVPERIRKQLKENGYLEESYWESVSEAAFKLVEQYTARINGGVTGE